MQVQGTDIHTIYKDAPPGRVYYTQSVTLYVVLALENMVLSSDTILLFLYENL